MEAILFLLAIGVFVGVFVLPVVIAVNLSNFRREHEAGLKSLRADLRDLRFDVKRWTDEKPARHRSRAGRTPRAKSQSRTGDPASARY